MYSTVVDGIVDLFVKTFDRTIGCSMVGSRRASRKDEKTQGTARFLAMCEGWEKRGRISLKKMTCMDGTHIEL